MIPRDDTSAHNPNGVSQQIPYTMKDDYAHFLNDLTDDKDKVGLGGCCLCDDD